ncbi:FitA-like ribbon-helix-helix domain-containing protein [Actinomycetospora chiangmaiensis]|uniref:FitA-like ribbon-helix-helix domain-containing protein n=1 Tax=Actinomycetospora chiangmaiensis TaxID=402650 RepID=UPI0003602D64|nr:Arc family DNA-binding protein [Actinomycetospora chiangmaiensis]
MATITVRDLDEEVRSRLRVRAAENGRSMEAEVRAILEAAVRPSRPERRRAGLQKARALAAEVGGLDDVFANIPPRDDYPREDPFDR